MKPLMFAMPGAQDFAARLCRSLDWEPGQLQTRHFPDGETYLRFLSEPDGRSIAIVATLDRPDRKLLALYFAARVARELGAARLGLILPYLPYMRQDARFQTGEGITSRHFASLLSGCCDWLITVDPHLHRHHDLNEIYSAASRVVNSAPAIAAWIMQQVSRPVLIGPDAESEQWVAEVARAAGCGYQVLQKVRHGDRAVEVSLADTAALRGLTPVLVDDIVSTARTMIAAVTQLNAAGLAPPVCIAVHALFCGDAYRALHASGARHIVSCDTVPHASNQISVCELLANTLRDWQKAG